MIVCVVIVETVPSKLVFAFLTYHVLASFVLYYADPAARSCLRPPHFLQLVQQPDVHVPAAASRSELRPDRLHAGFGPCVLTLVSRELVCAAPADVSEADKLAALPRSLKQRATVRR